MQNSGGWSHSRSRRAEGLWAEKQGLCADQSVGGCLDLGHLSTYTVCWQGLELNSQQRTGPEQGGHGRHTDPRKHPTHRGLGEARLCARSGDRLASSLADRGQKAASGQCSRDWGQEQAGGLLQEEPRGSKGTAGLFTGARPGSLASREESTGARLSGAGVPREREQFWKALPAQQQLDCAASPQVLLQTS